MAWEEYRIRRAGEVLGLVARPDGEVEQAGIDQARTPLSREELERHDLVDADG